jgi:hypothetical protein
MRVNHAPFRPIPVRLNSARRPDAVRIQQINLERAMTDDLSDPAWFARNPHRRIRRRLLSRDPERWALVPRGANEPTIVAGRLGVVDDDDVSLLVVWLELLRGSSAGTIHADQVRRLLALLTSGGGLPN